MVIKNNRVVSRLASAFLILFITLVLFELSLRITGFFLQEKTTSLLKDQFTVLVLGESTSAEAIIENVNSWPTWLSKILKERGINVNIVNKAKPATTTTSLVENLPDYIERYHPQVVVSMMGINDDNRFWLNESGLITEGNFFHDLRVVKLVKLFFHLKKIVNENEILKPNGLGISIKEEKMLVDMVRTKQSTADQWIEKFLQTKTDKEKSQFYAYLSFRIRPKYGSGDTKGFSLAHEYHKKGLALNLRVEMEAEQFLIVSQLLGRPIECKWLLERFQNENIVPTDSTIARFSACLPDEAATLNRWMVKLNKSFYIRPNPSELPTAANYTLMKKTLERENICLVAMQYPLLAVDKLKSYFTKEDRNYPRVFFLSNEENFKNLLKKYSFDEVFYDKFAGVFGHSRDLGNKAIAENVASLLETLIREKKCD